MKCAFRKRGDCTSGRHYHHVVKEQRIIRRLRTLRNRDRTPNAAPLTEAERHAIDVPLKRILRDRRNLVLLCDHHHHQVHHFGLRVTLAHVPRISEFAREFALEAALDHELRLMAR